MGDAWAQRVTRASIGLRGVSATGDIAPILARASLFECMASGTARFVPSQLRVRDAGKAAG
ncbi:MAG TPA: hypothetical protein VJR92_10950 [Gemmatimonadaceae bacterium]|nr:hypothetical protein [Gemmatimonadaceae bacterium]